MPKANALHIHIVFDGYTSRVKMAIFSSHTGLLQGPTVHAQGAMKRRKTTTSRNLFRASHTSFFPIFIDPTGMLVPPFCGNWFSPWRTVEKLGIFSFFKCIFSLSFGRYYFLLVSRQKQFYESTIEVNSGNKLRQSSLRFTRIFLEVSFMLSLRQISFLMCGMYIIHGVLRIHFSMTAENWGRFTLLLQSRWET